MHQLHQSLPTPILESVVLRCMRLWVMQMRRGIRAEPQVIDLLERLGAPSASPYLERFMLALSTGATRMIEVQCVCRPLICADERALLDVLSLAQDLRSFEALLILRGFTTPDGATAALQDAEGVGSELAKAGCLLPPPDETIRLFAMAPGPRAGTTLH